MSIATAEAKKLRGGYYTPVDVAKWLAKWAIRTGSDRILEPSCGDGEFVSVAQAEIDKLGATWDKEQCQITAIELIPDEAEKARQRVASVTSEIVSGDFFEWVVNHGSESTFDVLLGNPPFIRYQHFPEPSRTLAMKIMESQGLRPNRLTNIWVPFVVAGVSLLKEDGRLAMVIPAELLQVTYAGQLRQFMADSFRKITIYACNEMFFKSAEQEVVLLLAEGKLAAADANNKCDVSLVEAKTVSDLIRLKPRVSRKGTRPKLVQHNTEKWLKYFLDAAEIDFMRALRENASIAPLKAHGSVDVGVVTGKNEFFVLCQDQVDIFEAADFVTPLVGRSSQLSGAVIKAPEFQSLAKEGKKVYLLNLAGRDPEDFTPGIRRMIATGEKNGVHLGYKCRIRKPWYKVPAIWEPDCFFFRQIYDFPRVVVNKAGATSTDTIHRLRCNASASKVASNIYTYLTAASAEIEGRSYGGGVLELEPTEAERLLFPRTLNGAMPIGEADRLVRAGRLEDVLDHNNKMVLQDSLGLSPGDCAMLKKIWIKMRDRRMSRRKS